MPRQGFPSAQPWREVVLDDTNPLCDRLLAGYIPTSPEQFFGKAARDAAKTSGFPRFVYDPKFGVGIRRNDTFTSGIQQTQLTHRIDPGGDCTILSVARPTSAGAAATQYTVTTGQNSNAVAFGIRSTDGTNKVYQGQGYIGVGTKYFGGSFAVPADRPVAVVVARHIYNTEQAIFVDGVKDPAVGNFTGGTTIFNNFGCLQTASETEHYLLLIWDRALSDDEIASISADPYQIFDQQPRRLFTAVKTARFAVGKSLPADYAVRMAVAKDLSPDYSVRNMVSVELVSAYSVRGAVNKSLTPSYSIRTAIGGDLVVDYRLLGNVAYVDLVMEYAVRATAGISLTSSYSVRALVAKSLSVGSSVRAATGRELTPSYAIAGVVKFDLLVNYAILSGVNPSEVNVPPHRIVHFGAQGRVVSFDTQGRVVAFDEIRNNIVTFSEPQGRIVEFVANNRTVEF